MRIKLFRMKKIFKIVLTIINIIHHRHRDGFLGATK